MKTLYVLEISGFFNDYPQFAGVYSSIENAESEIERLGIEHKEYEITECVVDAPSDFTDY